MRATTLELTPLSGSAHAALPAEAPATRAYHAASGQLPRRPRAAASLLPRCSHTALLQRSRSSQAALNHLSCSSCAAPSHHNNNTTHRTLNQLHNKDVLNQLVKQRCFMTFYYAKRSQIPDAWKPQPALQCCLPVTWRGALESNGRLLGPVMNPDFCLI